MGLLANGKDKTLTYNESKKYQKFYKKISALQITKLLKTFLNFQNNEANRLKYGIEQEYHLMTIFDSLRQSMSYDPKTMKSNSKIIKNKEYSVSLQKEEYIKNLPSKFHENLDFMPEYAAWMVEIVPKKPFSLFLNAKEINNHLDMVDSLNKLNLTFKQEKNLKKKRIHNILSASIVPKLGYSDFYIRPNGERIPYVERKENNYFSNSKYFIDETVSKHIRFPTLTRNTALKRGSNVEINIPIFIDSKTKVRFKNMYEEPESYSDIPYKIKETILNKKKIKNDNLDDLKNYCNLIFKNNRTFISSDENNLFLNNQIKHKNIQLKKSRQSDSTCDSAKKNCCLNPKCPILKKKCEIKSNVCKILFEKKMLINNHNFEKKDLIKEFEITDKEESRKNNFIFNKDYITLDSFGFGMGNSCVQITYSSRNINEARKVYDYLSVFSSFMTAFSASTAIVDSVLINWDARLRLIEQSTDSRSKSHYVSLIIMTLIERKTFIKEDTLQSTFIFQILQIDHQYIMIKNIP